MAIPLLPAPRMGVEVERALWKLADERMLAPAREAGYTLAVLGATSLPTERSVAETDHGKWLFVNHLDDPTADEYAGDLPIPPDQLEHLAALDAVGVNPQLAWIGHQLPEDYRIGDPIPRLVPPPRELRERDQRLALTLGSIARVWAMTLGALIAAPAAAGVAALSLVGTDPIIFGGVRHPEQPVVAWCVLCSWDWE